MAFTEAQKDKIVAALNAKNVVASCPACSSRDWHLVDEVISVPLSGLERAMPCVGLMCANCGNVLLMNIFKLDVRMAAALGIQPAAQENREQAKNG